jgi:hypothetical protein
MKVKVETTFDNSISYVQDLAAAKWLVKEECENQKRKKEEFIITKI